MATAGVFATILRKGAARYEQAVANAWRKAKKPDERFAVGEVLVGHDRARYGPEMLDFARSVLADDEGVPLHGDSGIWMVQTGGAGCSTNSSPISTARRRPRVRGTRATGVVSHPRR